MLWACEIDGTNRSRIHIHNLSVYSASSNVQHECAPWAATATVLLRQLGRTMSTWSGQATTDKTNKRRKVELIYSKDPLPTYSV